jgi:Alpha/beta hydrolase domain
MPESRSIGTDRRGEKGMTIAWRHTALGCAVFVALAFSDARAADAPAVTGPITGGSHGRPFGSSFADLNAPGYVEEEYFVEGKATAYRADKPLTPDGQWTVSTGETQPYKTRLLVRRPKDPAKFNGTVVLEWQNVSGGFDVDAEWGYAYPEIMREGYVWVGISAQRAGVMGPPLRAGFSQPLTLWDVARYGSLSVPNDDFSYDIFTQAARLVGPHRPSLSPDPLGGLKVERILGVGVSQSANRLATYTDAVAPTAQALDGILIGSRIGANGGAAPLAADQPMPGAVKIRTDLKVPVLVTETESDAPSHQPSRTPDGEHYRLWEMAGTAHQNKWADSYFGAGIKRDLGVSGLGGCDKPVNDLPTQDVARAALHAINIWVKDGKAPATVQPISISGTAIDRDGDGNALGGLRLPAFAVPVARYGGLGEPPDRCRLEGVAIPFDKARLKALYPSRDVYLQKFKDAVGSAQSGGFILPPEAAEEIRWAETVTIP